MSAIEETEMREAVHEDLAAIIGDYEINPLPFLYPESCCECSQRAFVRSVALHEQGFRWCLGHFMEVLAVRIEHAVARRGHEEEIDLLVGRIHAAYHYLSDAVETIESLAVRFPECADLPLAPTSPSYQEAAE